MFPPDRADAAHRRPRAGRPARRYLAAAGLSWWSGPAVAPLLGTQLLGASPATAFRTAAAIALAAGSRR